MVRSMDRFADSCRLMDAHAYHLSPFGDLAAYSLDDGSVTWSLNFKEDFAAKPNFYGFGASTDSVFGCADRGSRSSGWSGDGVSIHPTVRSFGKRAKTVPRFTHLSQSK